VFDAYAQSEEGLISALIKRFNEAKLTEDVPVTILSRLKFFEIHLSDPYNTADNRKPKVEMGTLELF
ncbi:unnamed protein product, partial [Didymodactylos carnosus]